MNSKLIKCYCWKWLYFWLLNGADAYLYSVLPVAWQLHTKTFSALATAGGMPLAAHTTKQSPAFVFSLADYDNFNPSKVSPWVAYTERTFVWSRVLWPSYFFYSGFPPLSGGNVKPSYLKGQAFHGITVNLDYCGARNTNSTWWIVIDWLVDHLSLAIWCYET